MSCKNYRTSCKITRCRVGIRVCACTGFSAGRTSLNQILKQLHQVTMRYCLPFTPTRKGHLPFSLPKTNQDFLEGRLKSLKIFCLWLFALHPLSISHVQKALSFHCMQTHECLHTVLLFYTTPRNLHNGPVIFTRLVSLGFLLQTMCHITVYQSVTTQCLLLKFWTLSQPQRAEV